MKLLIFTLIVWSSAALAEVPEIRASQVTCQELKSFVQEHGTVNVLKRSFFRLKKVLVTPSVECSSDEYQVSRNFRTLDEFQCEVGYYCKTYVTYSGGSSDSGHSDGYSGGYSGGHSGGSTGPSYNPPSSSDRGPSYNPPERGERGPRYCPGCSL